MHGTKEVHWLWNKLLLAGISDLSVAKSMLDDDESQM